ncbi:MAG TPA: tetratricopeptide repeat protein, partial [Flavitalea sp.]|nr:tetratricopeptide repeat protein [Flavitalea sp.]
MTLAKTTPLTTKRFGMLLILLAVIAIVLFNSYSASSKKITRASTYINFDFRKIDGYIDDSARYFKAIDSLYSSLPVAQGKYEKYGCKRGYFLFVRRDPYKTLLYTDSMLLVLNELKDDPAYHFWYSTALAYKGDDLRSLGRYSEAFGFYFLARENIQKTGDSCLYGNYSATLGLVAYQQKNYADASEYYKQAYLHPTYCEDNENGNTAHL